MMSTDEAAESDLALVGETQVDVNGELDDDVGETLGDTVTVLLRNTVQELEVALADSRQLLEAKDEELSSLRREHDRLKASTAREISIKTELSSALEESRRHATALECLVERWQEELRHAKASQEQLQAQLHEVNTKLQVDHAEFRERQEEMAATNAENEQLKQRITELERSVKESCTSPTSSSSSDMFRHSFSGSGVRAPRARSQSVDPELNWAFLKTSVFHYFTDFHPYEQAKAIVSILDFDAQERKAIYCKLDEKYGKKFVAGLGRLNSYSGAG